MDLGISHNGNEGRSQNYRRHTWMILVICSYISSGLCNSLRNRSFISQFCHWACLIPPTRSATMPSATLIRPPPLDPSKSAIENVLELTTLADIGPVRPSFKNFPKTCRLTISRRIYFPTRGQLTRQISVSSVAPP